MLILRAGLGPVLMLVAAPAWAACLAPEAAGDSAVGGMVWVPGGSFTMGEDDAQPEERPAHRVTVSGFWIGRHEVTNAEFATFVAATGHVTVAERGVDPARFPGMPPELL